MPSVARQSTGAAKSGTPASRAKVHRASLHRQRQWALWGSYAALAAESYTFQHVALFSSELLRGFFRRHQIGAYAHGSERGDAVSRSFQNAITRVPAPSAADLARTGPRRLLFYARPEPHAARNMFELGVLALARAVAEHEVETESTRLLGHGAGVAGHFSKTPW